MLLSTQVLKNRFILNQNTHCPPRFCCHVLAFPLNCQQVDEILRYSAALNDTTKMIAEVLGPQPFALITILQLREAKKWSITDVMAFNLMSVIMVSQSEKTVSKRCLLLLNGIHGQDGLSSDGAPAGVRAGAVNSNSRIQSVGLLGPGLHVNFKAMA